jgi:DNA repair exonuclease SbcCD ATPase subunit
MYNIRIDQIKEKELRIQEIQRDLDEKQQINEKWYQELKEREDDLVELKKEIESHSEFIKKQRNIEEQLNQLSILCKNEESALESFQEDIKTQSIGTSLLYDQNLDNSLLTKLFNDDTQDFTEQSGNQTFDDVIAKLPQDNSFGTSSTSAPTVADENRLSYSVLFSE